MKTTIFLLSAFLTMVFFFVLAPLLGLAIPALLISPRVWLVVAVGVLFFFVVTNNRD